VVGPGKFCCHPWEAFATSKYKKPQKRPKTEDGISVATPLGMEVSLYQAAAAMNATSRWEELISENLGISSIPGARKQEVSFSAVQAGLASSGSGSVNPGYVIPSANSAVNFSQGESHPTGIATDLALEGTGMFTIQLSADQQAYTRNGQFKINSQHQLVTAQGFPVLGESGPIRFDSDSSKAITVSASGQVSQGDVIKGKLQIAEFNRPGQLTSIGSGLFRADESNLKPSGDSTTQVRQGCVESANSSATKEMASLVTAMRMFESNQKVLQMQSDRMSREISDLGNPV
jgi:flagellar basal body rod protein FlgG